MPRCRGITTKGEQCLNEAIVGSQYCHHHENQKKTRHAKKTRSSRSTGTMLQTAGFDETTTSYPGYNYNAYQPESYQPGYNYTSYQPRTSQPVSSQPGPYQPATYQPGPYQPVTYQPGT